MKRYINKENAQQGRVPFKFIMGKYVKNDPVNMAKLTSTKFDTKTKEFRINIMAKQYIVRYPEAEILNNNNQLVQSYTIKIMILRYLVNGQGALPTGKNITYKEIPEGYVYYSNFYNRTILRLAEKFGYDLKKFEELFKAINAEKVEMGDIACRFEFINNVFFTFIIWKGDDEFPPSANILFDSNICSYFNAEDLAVVVDIAIDALANNGDIPVDLGMYDFK